MAATTLDTDSAAPGPSRPVVRKHHWLVRWTHWLNVPLLLGLALSGLSIYNISPVLHHAPDARGNTDYLADIGLWVARHEPWRRAYGPPDAWAPGTRFSDTWVYDHASLGTGILATALRLHWLFAYLFMLNGLLYLVALGLGGGYQSLLPRRGDLQGALRMQVYYVGLPVARLLKRPWTHPAVTTKYNALQRAAYLSVPVMGLLAVGTGWAIHKPAQLGWLAALFGGYDWARVWHFWLTWAFLAFTVPHVLLVLADGWDTLRSMIVGWSDRARPPGGRDGAGH